jgi:hypothetical protein
LRAGLAVLTGCREPVVIVLLLISFFSAISGKPLDGLLMLVAGVCLAWDAGRRRAGHVRAGSGAAAGTGGAPVRPGTAAPGPPAGTGRLPGTGSLGRPGRWRLAAAAAVLAAAGYAVLVGSFTRFSWPATVGVVVPGVAAVVAGWRATVRDRPAPARLPGRGTAVWGGLLGAAGLWELSALLQQPSLTTDSYAHPTLSTLTDPVLFSAPGRGGLLLAWLALGWWLVRR